MQNLLTDDSPGIKNGWKQAAAAGVMGAISLAAAQPASAGVAITNTSTIESMANFNANSGNYDYSYTFGFTVSRSSLNAYAFAIPVFDENAITNVVAPQGWTGSILGAGASIWNTIYNPALDPKDGTYIAPASAFAAGQVPFVLQFSSNLGGGSSTGSISGFSFSSPYAPVDAPFVARITTEGFGDFDMIGDPLVPNSPSFPVPEPSGSALLLAAGALFAARRQRV